MARRRKSDETVGIIVFGIVVIYAVFTLATFGYSYYHTCRNEYGGGAYFPCSVLAGTFWPVYWSGYAALSLFEPDPPEDDSKMVCRIEPALTMEEFAAGARFALWCDDK